MKKLLLFALSIAVALSLSACSINIDLGANKEIENTSGSTVETGQNETVSSDKSTVQSQEEKTETKQESSVSQSSSEIVKDTTDNQSQSVSSQSNQITKDKALSIALKDAVLKKTDVSDLEIELDRDKGMLKYEISFEYNREDYEYDINALTGKIISVEKPNASSNEATVTKAEAKDIALKHAGVKSADIKGYQIELEKDDGIWKYEISFHSGNIEYEYVINAQTGKIIESEKDIDD